MTYENKKYQAFGLPAMLKLIWPRAAVAALMLFAWLPSLAIAQEADQKFSVQKSDGTSVGSYETQEQAEAAIRAIPGPANAPDAYQYVTEIKSTSLSADGHISIIYWMGKKERTLQYFGINGQSADTEEELISESIGMLNQGGSPPCASSTFLRTSEWSPFSPDFEGMEIANYHYTYPDYDADDGTCSVESGDAQIMRISICPNPYMSWKDDQNACINEEFTATVVTTQMECTHGTTGPSGLFGNPCDVKTGDKYEAEKDIDLGWIELERYYHSGVVASSGRWGLGWSDSHQIHLSIASPYFGVIEGSGYVTLFMAASGEYLAANGSGERIIADGSSWKLYRQDGVYTFDGEGRLISRENEDANKLFYSYDQRGRLQSIISAQGRSIEFAYADTSSDAQITGVSSQGSVLASYAYDNGRLSAVTYSDGGQRTYHYEDARFPRHLTGITAEDGQRFGTFAYDDKGRAVSSTHAGGADASSFVYTPAGTIATDALGEQSTFTMTGAGDGSPKISSITNSAGTETYSYYDASTDFRRRLSAKTDRGGVVTKHTYGDVVESGVRMSVHTVQRAFGLPEQSTVVTHTATDSNRLLRLQSDRAIVSYARNARLQPQAVTTTDIDTNQVRVTAISYCETADVSAPGSTCPILGLIKAVDGPRTDVADSLQYTYYPGDDAGCTSPGGVCRYRKGDLWKVTNALGQVTEYLSYDGVGHLLAMKDANGLVTDYTYHLRGWLTGSKVRGGDAASENDDRITLIDYWPTGLVKQVTQPDGTFTYFTYDAAQRLTDITDNAGNTLHYTTDLAGNRVKEDTKDASGTLKRTLSRVYNQLGQLATQATAGGDPTDFGYDANGNTETVTDALGHVTQNDYDPLNRLARTLQDVGGIAAETKFSYDALDNLTKVTDPKGLDTTYAYNGLGDLTTLTSPDTGTTTYTYDSASNRASQTDARNVTTTYSYDALNRLIQVGYPTSSLNVTYAYDVNQAVCTSGETYAVGRLTRMQDGSGTTDYCYDRFGDLVRKVQTTNGKVFVLRYAYTKAGQLSRLTYPDGAAVDYVRNAQGQTTEVGVTPAGGTRQVLLGNATYYPFGPVASWSYGNGRPMQRVLDQDYRPLAVSDTRTDGLSTGFAFDPAGNLSALTAAGNTAPVISLDYDALGRLTAFKDGPTGTVIDGYSYDATGNRLGAKVNTTTQTYSYPTTSHRLSAVAGTTRTYDAVGNTLSIGGIAQEFVYDTNGRMGQAKRAGAVVMNYQYNGRGEQVRKFLGTTGTYTLYDETGHWLGDYDSTGQALQQAIWLDDLPVGVLASNSLHYVQPDHLGTPRAVIDPVRDVAIWKWDLKGEAFGNSLPDQDPDQDGMAFVFDMRFPGQRYDTATGLNQNYFRDYDPGTGRYAQSDPIGLSGGKGTFSYANSNPIYLHDEIGLRAKCRCTPDGVEININLEFIGAAADPQVIASMRSSIEQIWSTPDFKVTTSIGGWRATKIEIVPGTGTSYMQGNRGKWFAANDPWVAAHEAGHIMEFKYDGRFDMYDIVSENPRKSLPVQGWEGNIMGQFFGQPDDRARGAIKRELKCK
ncbi:DUF6531 domain-containing protein [Xanthomonas sp. AM6]|uniref:RHS repeat-associated core domain-containing protein n=1 Tax=Xanthomonas sp. AM6 TaxID=2982531 RepID=UPI0021D9F2C5|nr:RHS repeat-associated core domain-containing protein [Xanthomonas sp. AM6]UYB52373.1 DUF6531 domain-containing protein [Xanthomonas sp. AM6]